MGCLSGRPELAVSQAPIESSIQHHDQKIEASLEVHPGHQHHKTKETMIPALLFPHLNTTLFS
jgi:hypothetical protein